MRVALVVAKSYADGQEQLVDAHQVVIWNFATRSARASMSTSAYAISLASVQQAAARIDGSAHRTPVLTCETLDALMSSSATSQQRVRLFFKVNPRAARVCLLLCRVH